MHTMAGQHDHDDQNFIELLNSPETALKHAPTMLYTCAIRSGPASETLFIPTFITSNIKDIFGYDAAGILGQARWWQDHLHPDDRPRILKGLEALFAEGRLSHSYRFRHREGDYLWVQDDVALVRDQAGDPLQILGAWRDISLRLRTVQELRKYYDQYRRLFENITDIYYQTDMDGHVQLISPSCLEQTGYAPEELLGRPVTDFYADPAQREELLEALRQKETVNDFELELVAKDGSTRHASVTSHILRDRNGRQLGVEGILRNVTERHRDREQLSMLLQENRSLMLQLMQVQEEERRLLARELHDELGQLLTGISVRAEYIGRKTTDADISSKANEIAHETDALFSLSRAILKRLRPASLDTLGLSAALKELVDNWNAQTGAECTLHIDEDIDHLDEMHTIAIYRLVQEGLTNAYRHGKADRVDLVIQVLPPSEDQLRLVQIEIEDNGKGIHVENFATGMGLIGMRERVHALGGVFLITDLPRDGVRIEATIPLEGTHGQ
jgi:PAS domain S-box-containing protein